MRMNLNSLPGGARYEDRYGGYLAIFEEIANCGDKDVLIDGAPGSWMPLLWHLNCRCINTREVFEHCSVVLGAVAGRVLHEPVPKLDRTTVEVLSAFRPECSDALWKCDMQWKLHPFRIRRYEDQDQFVVNVNGAWHRHEVMDYFNNLLGQYEPEKRSVLLVPCAADKPYPADMHKKVLELMPEEFYMANITGVLGIVPQDLWPEMPHYDCGVPNDWRVFQTVRNYFTRYPHQRIVVYLDYYGLAVYHGLNSIGTAQIAAAQFVNEIRFYFDYLDLMAEGRLLILDKILRDPSFAAAQGPFFGADDDLPKEN